MEITQVIEAIEYLKDNGCHGLSCKDCPINEKEEYIELCEALGSI